MKLAPLKDLHMVKEIRLLTVRRDEIPPRKLLLYPPYSLFPVLLRQTGRRHYLLLTLPVLGELLLMEGFEGLKPPSLTGFKEREDFAPVSCIPEAILTALILSPHLLPGISCLFLLARRRGDDCGFLGPLGDVMSYLLLFLGFNFFFFPYPIPLGM